MSLDVFFKKVNMVQGQRDSPLKFLWWRWEGGVEQGTGIRAPV